MKDCCNTKRAHRRQGTSVTGRDGYIMAQALAYAILTIEALPEPQQEWSNKEDMKRLLDHHLSASMRRQFLDNARLHLGIPTTIALHTS